MARRRFKPDGHDVELTSETAPAPEGVHPSPAAPAEPEFDLVMASTPAPAPPPPVAVPLPPTETLLLPLEERLRRVEAALTRLAELQEADPQPRAAQVTTHPGAPSVLSRAAALLPALSLPSRPAAGATAPVSAKLGILRDMLAELQAIYYMYVDPRYRLSHFGRFVPLALLGLFLTSSWWMTLVGCGVGKFFVPLADLAICYVLFKVLNVEARRYRETAPDLPPHLRL